MSEPARRSYGSSSCGMHSFWISATSSSVLCFLLFIPHFCCQPCFNNRSCNTCVVAPGCRWCGLVVAGNAFSFGECANNCDGMYFGNSRSLAILDYELLNVKVETDPDSPTCTTTETSVYELRSRTCADCLAVDDDTSDYGWCGLEITYSSGLVSLRGGICFSQERWQYCDATIIKSLRPNSGISVILDRELPCSTAHYLMPIITSMILIIFSVLNST